MQCRVDKLDEIFQIIQQAIARLCLFPPCTV